MIRQVFRMAVAAALAVGLAGCGGDDGQTPKVTASTLTDDGWARFEAGRLEEALVDFEQALTIDRAFGDAYSGIGWCYVRLDSLGPALASFDSAIVHGVLYGDPHAGKAVVYRDLEPVDFSLAIDSALSALYYDPFYVFPHDITLDWYDLRLILAHSFIALREYGKAKYQVDLLNPGNTLDPQSETFVDELILEVERLGGIY